MWCSPHGFWHMATLPTIAYAGNSSNLMKPYEAEASTCVDASQTGPQECTSQPSTYSGHLLVHQDSEHTHRISGKDSMPLDCTPSSGHLCNIAVVAYAVIHEQILRQVTSACTRKALQGIYTARRCCFAQNSGMCKFTVKLASLPCTALPITQAVTTGTYDSWLKDKHECS